MRIRWGEWRVGWSYGDGGVKAAESPQQTHTGLFVQHSLGCLRQSMGQREGAAPGKLTDGDALQGPGPVAPSVGVTFSPVFIQLHSISVLMQAHLSFHV